MQTNTYDFAVIGSGMGGLAIASLLAKEGKKVCLIEANDTVGGHAHTFKAGKYSFCHDVQYLMGCQPGGLMHRFLKRLDLDKVVEFRALDPKCFDIISLDGKRIKVPHGSENYESELCKQFPTHAEKLKKYFHLERGMFNTIHYDERLLSVMDVIKNPVKFLPLLYWTRFTVTEVFDKFDFPIELRAILSGRIGNISASPHEASFCAYAGMDQAYCTSAYFPKKGMGFFIDQLLGIIKQKGDVVLSNAVQRICMKDGKVEYVLTQKGPIHAKQFISDVDPQKTFEMISEPTSRKKLTKNHTFPYSDSVIWIYLGLKNFNPDKLGFKRANIWHHSLLDVEKEYSLSMNKNDFHKPMLFISIPSHYADEGVLCPKNCHTMEIAGFANYDKFHRLFIEDKKKYEQMKKKVTKQILDVVKKYYLPDLEKYVEVKVVHTPVDEERLIRSPRGNIYGCRMTPKFYSFSRMAGARSFFGNLHMVGASVSYPGIHGTTLGAMTLFDELKRKDNF